MKQAARRPRQIVSSTRLIPATTVRPVQHRSSEEAYAYLVHQIQYMLGDNLRLQEDVFEKALGELRYQLTVHMAQHSNNSPSQVTPRARSSTMLPGLNAIFKSPRSQRKRTSSLLSPHTTSHVTPPASPRLSSSYTEPTQAIDSDAHTIDEALTSLLPKLLPPPLLALQLRQQMDPHNPFFDVLDTIRVLAARLDTSSALYHALKTIERLYDNACRQSLDASPEGIPATLIHEDAGFLHIPQVLARTLCRVNQVGAYSSSHYLSEHAGMHHKLSNTNSSLDVSIGQFVSTLTKQLFSHVSHLVLTPTTLLRVANTLQDNHPIPVQYISSSLTVPGISLDEWLMILRTIYALNSVHGEQGTKSCIRRFLTEDYICDVLATDTHIAMSNRVIAGQLAIPNTADRILDFAAPHTIHLSDRLNIIFAGLLIDEKREQFNRVCAFILTWPELVAGFTIFEVFKWVPLMLRLPEFFLRLSQSDQIPFLGNEAKLSFLVDILYSQLASVWDLLHLESALTLTVLMNLLLVKDGKGANIQVCFEHVKASSGNLLLYRLKHWYTVWIDIDNDILQEPIIAVNHISPTSSSGGLSPGTPPLSALSTPRQAERSLRHHAGGRCILSFLPPIQSAVLAAHVSLRTSIEAALLNTFAIYHQYQTRFNELQRRLPTLSPEQEDAIGMPLMLETRTIRRLYTALMNLQNFLSQKPTGTLWDYIESIDPLLAITYKEANRLHPNNPRDAFHCLETSILEDLLPLEKSMSAKSAGRIRPASQSGSSSSMLSVLSLPEKTIGDALALCPDTTRADESPKVNIEQALSFLLRQFPWKEDDEEPVSVHVLSWLLPIATTFPKICVTQLGLSITDCHCIFEQAVTKELDPVTYWLHDQGAQLPKDSTALPLLTAALNRRKPPEVTKTSPRKTSPRGIQQVQFRT